MHLWEDFRGLFGNYAPKEKTETVVMLYKKNKATVEIAGITGVGGTTVYRYLAEMKRELNISTANNH